ncbi:calbindin-like [Clytia hemisphaerica]
MFRYLEPFLLPHAFSDVRGRLKYSSVDVMQIWTYYNDDHTDTMDGDEIMVFVFDMLQNPKQRCNPKIIDSLTAKLIELSGEEEVTLRGFSKLLPLEDSIMDQYKDITKLDRKATLRVLAFYDQNDEGAIDGCELYALIKDVLESNGHKDPYNMEVILEKQEYLKEAGCLTPSGALDYTKTDIVFALGTEKASEEVV